MNPRDTDPLSVTNDAASQKVWAALAPKPATRWSIGAREAILFLGALLAVLVVAGDYRAAGSVFIWMVGIAYIEGWRKG